MNKTHKVTLTLAVSSLLAFGLPLASTINPAMATPLSGSPATFYPDLIADVAEAVAPSVVNIDIQRPAPAMTGRGLSGFPFSDDVLKRFFGVDPQNVQPGTPATPPLVRGNGSGMILDKNGYILTNNHVVASAEKVTVTLNDGRQFAAKVIGRDSYSDVAVIKIDAPNLTPVKLGNSDTLRPGEWVIAIGSPLGFDHTVTQGIVSALSRRIPDLSSNLSFIQTDAAINPGNSGGPLVNLKGEVIGINSAMSGRGQNIGFAIPVNTVKTIASTLISGKAVMRPWVGIAMVLLTPDLAQQMNLPADSTGIVVAQVMPDSPAAKAGILKNDIIQQVDGKAALKPDIVQENIRQKPIGAPVRLDLLRAGKPVSVTLVTEILPDSEDGIHTPAHPTH